MLEITIGIDPNILEIGPFVLAWHGILTVLGIIVGVWVSGRQLAERGVQIRNFDSFAFWTIAGGIAGARLFYVMDHLGRFADDPLEILAISEGGLAVYGAVIGGFATVALLCVLRGEPFRKIIDSIAPGLALAQAVGRIGCTINGDAWGAKTDSPFALVYTNPDAIIPNRLLNQPTHPYPIYDIAMNLAIVAIIWPLRKRNLPDGAIFAIFALLYAATRFVISYVREERVWFWGLQEAQVIALLTLVVSAAALVWLFRGTRDGDRALESS
jgi:phosphatidylglycerol---prolipoprotein diacylglyceryl transferase